MDAVERSFSGRGRAHVAVSLLLALASCASLLVFTMPAWAAEVSAWGTGPLGNPSLKGEFGEESAEPVRVNGLGETSEISAGADTAMALVGGSVLSWGANKDGELGTGSPEPFVPLPALIGGLSEVRAVSVGATHALALREDGTVMAWGENYFGELGVGTRATSDVPEEVSGLSGVRAVAAGSQQSLALLEDGHVMTWGDNTAGQLGDGVAEGPEVCGFDFCSNVPVEVPGLEGVTAIAAHGRYDLALLSDGKVMAWGSAENGALGTGSPAPERNCDCARSPVEVAKLSGVTAIFAASDHSLALLATGKVMAWGGDNFDGDLGDQAPLRQSNNSPVEVGALEGATAIAGGEEDSIALLANRNVVEWGRLATGGASAVPAGVCGLTQVTAISAASGYNLAYSPVSQEASPTVSSVTPSAGPLAGGTTVTITGSNLAEATAVAFGSTSASGFKVTASGAIEAVTPPGTGTAGVRVTTPLATSATCGPDVGDQFDYLPVPTVTKMSRHEGPPTGGVAVLIYGVGLGTATEVKFGSVDASFRQVGQIIPTILATSPAEAAGKLTVTVVTPGGSSAPTSKAGFKVLPSITELLPATGGTAGGTSVTVIGSGFSTVSGADGFQFGKTKAKITSCASRTECTVSAPAHVAGTVDVQVTVAKAKSAKTSADQFTYH